MSTNYYVERPGFLSVAAGPYFTPAKQLHIGKVTSGSVIVAVYDKRGRDDITGIGPIRSWADWRRILVDYDGPSHVIFDDYGRIIFPDTLFAMFEEIPPERRRLRHNDTTAAFNLAYAGFDQPGDRYLDADGFSCADYDFS